MSKTDTARPSKRIRADHEAPRRQPRPAPRRQGTRHGIIVAARKEG